MMFDNDQYLKVSLKNIKKNYRKLSSKLHLKNTMCSAVVKANAYGLGIEEITKALYEEGCRHFWVSNLTEALRVNVTCPESTICIFQGIKSKQELRVVAEYDLKPVITSLEQIAIINKYSKNNIDVVLNFDTGIGRDGIQIEEVDKLNLDKCNVVMLISHLSCSEQKISTYNKKQLESFRRLTSYFPHAQYSLSNSGGIFLGQEFHFDLVRVGGLLYGINIPQSKYMMGNVVEYYGSILNRKILCSDQYIGYNCTYKALKSDRILIINIGYYDGYSRMLSNTSKVFVEGYFLPVIGIVSMNMMAVDANQLPYPLFHQVKKVELLGKNITIREVAKLLNIDQREVLINVSSNSRKVYV